MPSGSDQKAPTREHHTPTKTPVEAGAGAGAGAVASRVHTAPAKCTCILPFHHPAQIALYQTFESPFLPLCIYPGVLITQPLIFSSPSSSNPQSLSPAGRERTTTRVPHPPSGTVINPAPHIARSLTKTNVPFSLAHNSCFCSLAERFPSYNPHHVRHRR